MLDPELEPPLPSAFRCALLVIVLTSAACADASPDVVTDDETTPPTPAVPVTPSEPTAPVPAVDRFPGVTAALTIDLARALPEYASPAWPVHYDAGVIALTNAPPDNPVTNAGATLGRVLFHDRRLSITNTISCASCHQQGNGFTDPTRFSVGFNTVDRTDAHSMRLTNLRFSAPAMFWDRRASTLESQTTQPIQNAVEMGFDAAHGGLDALITRMHGLRYYPELFRFVYGDTVITEVRIQRAIAQYLRSAVSTDSRFDRGFAAAFNPALPDRGVNAPFPSFTPEENRGKVLFLTSPQQGGGGCAACHTVPTFALAGNSRSNGLDANEARVFKSPSLKSVAATGPYMHDGRFATLDAVVEHYVSGVQLGPALDNKLRLPNGTPLRLALSPADKAALVAFMRTLTDETLATDPRFASPFRP
ncbi:MAG: cytochrome c peroxidase [Gemmatimonadota bacterium]